MKKALFFGVLLLVSMCTGQVLAAESSLLESSLQSYTPVPAQPGSYVTIMVKITNDGTIPTKNAVVEFIDNYPFSVDNLANSKKNIGILGAGNDYIAEFRVRIDGAAVEGTNYLKIRYENDASSENWIEKELPITISSAQKTVSINSVKVSPEMVAPGDQVTVQIKVKNLATANLRDIGVRLDLAGMLIGTMYVDIPLAPIGSSVEKKIASLNSGQTADFEFVLQAYPEAEVGIYKIPITLTYIDDAGEEFSRTDLMSIIINGKTDLMVQVESSSVYSDNGKGVISFAVTNKGFSEIKFLTVSLAKSDAYTITSLSDKVYVGNVDSDDYELVEFEIKMTSEGKETVSLPLTLEFKDALNSEFSTKETLTIPLMSTADAGKKKSNTGLIIVVVIIVVVVGFILLRRRSHKKHN
jgi:hypothetical protein